MEAYCLALNKVEEMKEPFRASEDFGHYTKQIPGAMFYLGDGDSAPLHTEQFDFHRASFAH